MSAQANASGANAPVLTNVPAYADFASDPRCTMNEQSGKWNYVGDDGISYEYDETMGAWFPMFDENLVEAQQSAYAVEGVDVSEPAVIPNKKKKVYTSNEGVFLKAEEHPNKKQKRDVKPRPVKAVYVAGLPLDATVEEVEEVFSKCGVIMEDIQTGGKKIKLYRDEAGNLKGDGVVHYFKEESVPLAINLLDEAEFRLGDSSSKITVQQAEFKEKDPGTATQKKTSTLEKMKARKKMHQLQRKLDWVDDEVGKKTEKFQKIVILKNMYSQQELDDDPTLLLELKDDVREECEKLGEVTNVIMYDKSPGGIISVRFKEVESAEACIKLMDKRFFAGKQISAEIYDGQTKYQKSGSSDTQEDEEAEKARLEKYAKWLESQEEDIQENNRDRADRMAAK
ncbi:hypothetical protein INT43_005658 [Umbelopsis isabellina]|uniref:RRM domain-containing protein n=1 Tax=Mortierella isabellina TaxID=91625 RepID=A0A8H7PLX6_MORIS|nr:hypothetical protein INT43_005658 [Umbelopsis isabellina]